MVKFCWFRIPRILNCAAIRHSRRASGKVRIPAPKFFNILIKSRAFQASACPTLPWIAVDGQPSPHGGHEIIPFPPALPACAWYAGKWRPGNGSGPLAAINPSCIGGFGPKPCILHRTPHREMIKILKAQPRQPEHLVHRVIKETTNPRAADTGGLGLEV